MFWLMGALVFIALAAVLAYKCLKWVQKLKNDFKDWRLEVRVFKGLALKMLALQSKHNPFPLLSTRRASSSSLPRRP